MNRHVWLFLLLCCCHFFFCFVLLSSGFVRSTRLFPIKTYWSNSHVLFCFSFLLDFGLSALSSGFDDLHSNRQRERESWFKRYYYYSGPLLLFAAAIVNYFIRADWSFKKKIDLLNGSCVRWWPCFNQAAHPHRSAVLVRISYIFSFRLDLSGRSLLSRLCFEKKKREKTKKKSFIIFCCFLSFFLVCARVFSNWRSPSSAALSSCWSKQKNTDEHFLACFSFGNARLATRGNLTLSRFLCSSLLHYHRQSAFCWENLKRGQFFSSIVELSYRIGEGRGGGMCCAGTHITLWARVFLFLEDWKLIEQQRLLCVCLSIYKTTNGCCDWWPIERHRSSSPLSLLCFVSFSPTEKEEKKIRWHTSLTCPDHLVTWSCPFGGGRRNRESWNAWTRNAQLFLVPYFFLSFSNCCCCVVCFGFGWQSRQVLKRPSGRIRSVTRVTAMHHSADGTRFHFSLNASHSLCFDRTDLTFTRLWPHSLSRAGPTDANGHHLKRSSTPLGR